MTQIVEGYAATAEAAVVFNETDTGREVIPFVSKQDAMVFCMAIIATGYGGAYNTQADDLYEESDFAQDDGFKGAVTREMAAERLVKGVDVDTMWDFEDIVIYGEDEDDFDN